MSGLAETYLVKLALEGDGGLGEEAQVAVFLAERDEGALEQLVDDLGDLVEAGGCVHPGVDKGGEIGGRARDALDDLEDGDGLRDLDGEREVGL